MRPLGDNQLERLLGLVRPGCMLIVADDKLSQSLLRRGLTKPHYPDSDNSFHEITPAGMRAVADAWEDGRLSKFIKYPEPKKK